MFVSQYIAESPLYSPYEKVPSSLGSVPPTTAIHNTIHLYARQCRQTAQERLNNGIATSCFKFTFLAYLLFIASTAIVLSMTGITSIKMYNGSPRIHKYGR